ncbi:hypothetical protein SHO565_69130 [Streptomyces sp. HO565]
MLTRDSAAPLGEEAQEFAARAYAKGATSRGGSHPGCAPTPRRGRVSGAAGRPARLWAGVAHPAVPESVLGGGSVLGRRQEYGRPAPVSDGVADPGVDERFE